MASDQEEIDETRADSQDGSRKLQRPIVRGAQACSQCRTHKIKCQPASEEAAFPCQRCRNQGLTCEVLRHNRGRKRKAPPGQDFTPQRELQQATVYYPDGRSAVEAVVDPAPSSADHRPPKHAREKSRAENPPDGATNPSAMHLLEEAIALHHHDEPGHGITPSSSGANDASPSVYGGGLPSTSNYSPNRDQQNHRTFSIPHPPAPVQHHYLPSMSSHSHTYQQPAQNHPQYPQSAGYGPQQSSMPVHLLPQPTIPTRTSPAASSANFIFPTLAAPKLHQKVKREEEDESAKASTKLEGMKFPFLIPRAERPGRKGMFTLRSLLNAEDVEEVGAGSDMAHPSEHSLLTNDPIDAGILSLDDAHTLFKLFMEEMNPMTCTLDPTVHTHDVVRESSRFLYISILSVVSRYLNSTTYAADGTRKRLISTVYTYFKQAAKAHLKLVLGEVHCSLEVVQGLCVMAFYKEPEDDKACLHLYRAIALARELGMDVPTPRGKVFEDENERTWVRIRQRIWLSMFISNTILTMQFDMKTLIGPDDSIVATSARWAVGSPHPSDTLLVASVQLRRLYHVYTDLARASESDMDTPADKASRLVSLSVLTRTANRDLEQAAKDWAEECRAAGMPGRLDDKLSVWLSAIKLKFNLTIIQMVLPGLKERASMLAGFLPPSAAAPGTAKITDLGCIAAFHHSVNSACYILQSMTILEEKRLLSFGTDTFLHFAIYSAFFLWTLCRDAGPELLDLGEVEHCYNLIAGAARALEMASIYPGDSPALHARFLRNLASTKSREGSRAATNGNGERHTAASSGLGFGASAGQTPHSAPGLSTSTSSSYHLPSLNAALSNANATPEGISSAPLPSYMGYSSTPDGGRRPSQQDNSTAQASLQPELSEAARVGMWGTGDADAMLTADWGTMQKDFPWAFNDFSMPFLDTATNGGLNLQPSQAPLMPSDLGSAPGAGSSQEPRNNGGQQSWQ